MFPKMETKETNGVVANVGYCARLLIWFNAGSIPVGPTNFTNYP